MLSFWEIYVHDMFKAKAFYTNVIGLEVVREQDDFIVLQRNGAKIHLCPREDMPEYLRSKGMESLGAGVEFCFETTDIQAVYSRALSSGYPIFEQLTDQPWGKTDFRLIDPDGAYIRVSSPRTRANLCLKN
ncbi:TPA: VOC family protein [Pseudomonas aeruginosa]|uniref:VOC family protein n=1 Tax=Citrobacter freundii TaxID=546 RepID=UPI00177EDBB0|nr:VOC family protein [Citrobacter freundii]MBD5678309.1 VOC family protein [Citrobacter freundii]HCF1493361.1 VOC family protein [Pseudomonas aeruginosa]HEK1521278.1 VOC family protein [Pseudomonas aeruginosa]HEK1547254.1 VOC family protein [Pseudomonas aeruginosa]